MSRFQRPSPAMIVALIALFAALGGTGYAALKLPKNSVSAKQVKKNAITTAKIKKEAVTGAKIKKGTITGADIDLAKLGTVPSAAVANSVPPLEGTHLIGAPGEPGFESGAANLGVLTGGPGVSVNTQPAGFYKDRDGTVHLQGLINTGGAVGPLFSLPAGFRPAPGTVLLFNVLCSYENLNTCNTDDNGDRQTYAQLIIAGANVNLPPFAFNGAVVAVNTNVTISLDGVSFRAAG